MVSTLNKSNYIFNKKCFNIFNNTIFYFPLCESDKSSLKSKDIELYTGVFFFSLTEVVSPQLFNPSTIANYFVVLGI